MARDDDRIRSAGARGNGHGAAGVREFHFTGDRSLSENRTPFKRRLGGNPRRTLKRGPRLWI